MTTNKDRRLQKPVSQVRILPGALESVQVKIGFRRMSARRASKVPNGGNCAKMTQLSRLSAQPRGRELAQSEPAQPRHANRLSLRDRPAEHG
jgi:hypothetical protein